jgi:hypothetical protein
MKRTSRTWRPRRSPVAVPALVRKDTHVTHENSPIGIGIDARMPSSMPRAEDDDVSRERSFEFHDRPGSGKRTADRQFWF